MGRELGQLLGERGKLGANPHCHWPVQSCYIILRTVDLLPEHALNLCYWHCARAVGRMLENETVTAPARSGGLSPGQLEGPCSGKWRKSAPKAISVLGQGTH